MTLKQPSTPLKNAHTVVPTTFTASGMSSSARTTSVSSPVVLARELLAPLIGNASKLDLAKSALFYYLLAVYARKSYWHLRARGITASIKDVYVLVSQVCQACILHGGECDAEHVQFVVRLILRLPSMRKKVASEMGKARLDIENKLVPKGAGVTRHLALPEEGMPIEWILAEMEKMDTELHGRAAIWNEGKLSGAVYRASPSLSFPPGYP